MSKRFSDRFNFVKGEEVQVRYHELEPNGQSVTKYALAKIKNVKKTIGSVDVTYKNKEDRNQDHLPVTFNTGNVARLKKVEKDVQD